MQRPALSSRSRDRAEPAYRLWQLWQQGRPPELEDFLSGEPGLCPAQVAALAGVDQRERWRRGERVAAEDYFWRHPGLCEDAAAGLDLVYGEFLLREELGEKPDPEEYAARFPEHAAEFVRQVSLHRALGRSYEGTESSEAVTLAAGLPTLPSLPAVPGYEVLGVLGQGGMGVVYMARHTALKRRVALKMVRAGGLADQHLARFRTEAVAVARLQHPNIVQIYEVGEHDGRPFLSLELVDGSSLEKLLRNGPLPCRTAARLIETVTRAVHFAHGQGIVHRDLKPGNILIPRAAGWAQTAASPVPSGPGGGPGNVQSPLPALTRPGSPLDPASVKVTDFGLAKQLGAEGSHTQTGAVLGTPAYMAPEQADGRTDLGPAADVYSLGAVLYELLTGRPPFRAGTVLEMLDQVKHAEPVRPRKLRDEIPRDLETVCLKCLEKESGRRYARAEALAEDLRLWRERRPIRARPATAWQRSLKWANRRPTAAALVLVSVAAGMALAAVLTILFQRENLLQIETEARMKAEQHGEVEAGLREQTQDALWRETRALYANRMLRANLEWHDSNVVEVRRLLDECPPDLRQWEWNYLDCLCHPGLRRLRVLGAEGPEDVANFLQATHGIQFAFSPDWRRIAAIGPANRLRVYSWPDGNLTRSFEKFPGQLVGAAFGPNGNLGTVCLASTVNADGRTLGSVAAPVELSRTTDAGANLVQVWDVQTGRELFSVPGPERFAHTVAFSPDGRLLAVAGRETSIVLCDTVTGRERFSLIGHQHHQHQVVSLVFSADSRRLASAAGDNRVKIWDLASRKEMYSQSWQASGWNSGLALNADGSRLLQAGYPDNRARVWDVGRKTVLTYSPTAHRSSISSLGFSPDGNRVVTTSVDRTIRVWETTTMKELLTLQGHGHEVVNAAFSADSKRLLSASSDGTVIEWDPAGNRAEVRQEFSTQVVSLAFTADSRRLAVGDRDGMVRLVDAASGKERATVTRHEAPLMSLAFRGDGRRWASVSWDGEIKLGDPTDGREIAPLRRGPVGVGRVRFSPDGSLLAASANDQHIRLWDAATGKERSPLFGHTKQVLSFDFSPNGRLLAGGGEDRQVFLWDVAATNVVGSGPRMNADVRSVAFHPGGRLLAASALGEVRLWEMPTFQEVLTFQAAWPVMHLAFTPDGKRLIYLTVDGAIHFWDTTMRQEVFTLPGPVAVNQCLAVSPDGSRVARGGFNQVTIHNSTPLGDQ